MAPTLFLGCAEDTRDGQRGEKASGYCRSDLPEGGSEVLCLSTPGVGVERAHLSSGWGSQQRHGPEPSDRAPGSGGFLGEKAARASGSLPHTLASLAPPADQMRAAAGSSERWRHSSTVANRPVFHPELVPRTRAIPLGTAETGASFWPPGTAGPRLSLWPPRGRAWLFACFPARGRGAAHVCELPSPLPEGGEGVPATRSCS